MASEFTVNMATGEFTITGRIDPANVRPSSTGKTYLLLAGTQTMIKGAHDVRGSVSLYVKDLPEAWRSAPAKAAPAKK